MVRAGASVGVNMAGGGWWGGGEGMKRSLGKRFIFFFKQKTAYEMCGRDWSSDVCSSDLAFNDIKHYAKRPFNLCPQFPLRWRGRGEERELSQAAVIYLGHVTLCATCSVCQHLG